APSCSRIARVQQPRPMALAPTRMEYRVRLSHVDREVEREQAVIAALHPSETLEHLTLRVLAWCLLVDERLDFGPGLSSPGAADLWSRDLTGRVTAWVECGATDAARVQHVLHHHTDALVHVVLDDERRRDELRSEWRALPRPPRGSERVTLWTIDP